MPETNVRRLTRDDLELIASGDMSPLPKMDFLLCEDRDYMLAAVYTLDEGGDDSDLRWFLTRELAYQEFNEWQMRDESKREFVDFDDWLLREGRAAMVRANETYDRIAPIFGDAR